MDLINIYWECTHITFSVRNVMMRERNSPLSWSLHVRETNQLYADKTKEYIT